MGGKWHLSREQSHLIAGHLRGTCLGRAGRHPHLILGSAAGRALVSHSKLGQSPNQPQRSPEDRLRLHHDFSAAQHPLLPSPATSPPSVTVPAPPGRAAMPAPVSRASIPGSQAVTLLTSLEERLRPRWREASWLDQLGTITWRMKLPGSSLWRGPCPQRWVSALKSSWTPI